MKTSEWFDLLSSTQWLCPLFFSTNNRKKMQLDFKVYPETHISKLHPMLRPVVIMVRELYKPFRKEKPTYIGDGISTCNNSHFLHTEKFIKAYSRCCKSFGNSSINIQWRVHQALWCVAQARRLEGDMIEFGVGKGLIMSSILEVYDGWEKANKTLFLVDTFSPYNVSQTNGLQNKENQINPFYATSFNEVKRNFSTFKHVEFVVGAVPDVLSSIKVNKLSFVHIDMNYSAPEIAALEFCWDKIVPGGVILLDDYAYRGHEDQYRAMNDLAKRLNFEILSTPTGQGIIVKTTH